MGCDIHCYIEYKHADRSGGWDSFSGRFFPGRDYGLFGHLAGVRYEEAPHPEPRGIPEDIAYYTSKDWWAIIDDDDADEHEDGYCTMEQANRWIRYGSVVDYDEEGKAWRVSNPDWHTPSWVTVNEFENAICQTEAHPDREGYPVYPTYHAMLAAMKSLESFGFQARLVFWFDN